MRAKCGSPWHTARLGALRVSLADHRAAWLRHQAERRRATETLLASTSQREKLANALCSQRENELVEAVAEVTQKAEASDALVSELKAQIEVLERQVDEQERRLARRNHTIVRWGRGPRVQHQVAAALRAGRARWLCSHVVPNVLTCAHMWCRCGAPVVCVGVPRKRRRNVYGAF